MRPAGRYSACPGFRVTRLSNKAPMTPTSPGYCAPSLAAQAHSRANLGGGRVRHASTAFLASSARSSAGRVMTHSKYPRSPVSWMRDESRPSPSSRATESSVQRKPQSAWNSDSAHNSSGLWLESR